ncbi:protein kinase [Nocardia fluminea]|uniref:serine/threonine-protein kinase n=1 Tax=Nocardia fluminea TaxID=134984 RepID=UPI00341CC4C5
MHDIGEVFAGFTIEAMLGQGGMGTVYLARHPRLDRLTALKLLNRDLFADERVRARFEREADLAAGLDHPGIVTVFDRGTEGEQLWISMQYVDGIDAATVDPMALPPERAVQIIEGVADALDYAHGRGVLHRDVKPANILLARSTGGQGERVFLTDFGIARLRADSTHLTQQGMFTATLAYASPEQMTGAELDHRSDQYSLACSLYWLFTGLAPFDSADPNEIIRGTLYAPPPPLALRRAGLPPIMDAVLAAAMAKHPAARFDSCTAFAKAARQALTSTTPPVLPRPPANPAPGYYPPAPQQGPAAYPQPGMAQPGYQLPPGQAAPQPHWQPPSRPFGAVPPVVPRPAAPGEVPPVAQRPAAPGGAVPPGGGTPAAHGPAASIGAVPPGGVRPVAQGPAASGGAVPPGEVRPVAPGPAAPGGVVPLGEVSPVAQRGAADPVAAQPNARQSSLGAAGAVSAASSAVEASGAVPPSGAQPRSGAVPSSGTARPSVGAQRSAPGSVEEAAQNVGDAGISSSPVSLDKSPSSAARSDSAAARSDEDADEVSATAATDVVSMRDAGELDAANAAALTNVTPIAGASNAAPAGPVTPEGAAAQSGQPRQPGSAAAQGNAEYPSSAGQPGNAGQPSGAGQQGGPGQQVAVGQPGGRGQQQGAVGRGMVPHRGYWPVPRRVSGVQRFGWVVLVALVVVLVALVVALVVVVLPGDDGDSDAESGASGPADPVAEVADSFAESRRVFPTLVPQGQMSDGVGYRGARCVGVRNVSELAWKEPALQWTPITTGWQCERSDNQAGALSYLVLEYANVSQARSVLEALPAMVRYAGNKDEVPFSLQRWVVPDPASIRVQTAHQVLSFPGDSARANYLVAVSRRGSSGAGGATRPSAQDEVIAWWDEVPL